MLGWLFSWEEAAKQPGKAVAAVCAGGLVAGGLIGYFRFGDSIGYGVALGVGVALIVGTFTWRSVRDPARVAELTRRRAELRDRSARAWGSTGLRLLLPFAALGIAAAAGAATGSVGVFLLTLAAALVGSLALSRFLAH